MVNNKKIYTTYGHVDSKGKLAIYNRDLFNRTIKDYFKSTSIELIISQKTYEFSDVMRSYYFAVVVKEVQKAYRSTGVIKSLKDVDSELRGMFLYNETYDEVKGVWETELHTLKKGDTLVTKKMMSEFVDLVIAWAIQNLDWAIPYPSENMDEDDFTEHQKNTMNRGNNYKSTF